MAFSARKRCGKIFQFQCQSQSYEKKLSLTSVARVVILPLKNSRPNLYIIIPKMSTNREDQCTAPKRAWVFQTYRFRYFFFVQAHMSAKLHRGSPLWIIGFRKGSVLRAAKSRREVSNGRMKQYVVVKQEETKSKAVSQFPVRCACSSQFTAAVRCLTSRSRAYHMGKFPPFGTVTSDK